MEKEIHELLKIQNDKTTIFTNKELKMIDDYINELEAYKYNLDRDYLRLEKENKILRENAEHNDKVVDKVNWENQLLKKQLEEINKFKFSYKKDQTKIPPIIRKQKDVETIKNLENQQKEFIEYLTSYIDLLSDDSDLFDEVQKDILEEILSKYKEIIG